MNASKPVPVTSTRFFRDWQKDGAGQPGALAGIEFGFPRGPLERYLRIVRGVTDEPDPFHEAALYTLVGAAIGRRAWVESDVRRFPNFFCVLIGPSGRDASGEQRRKTGAITIARKFAEALAVPVYPAEGTTAGLWKAISDEPAGVLVAEKVDELFGPCRRKQFPGLIEFLLRVYDNPNEMGRALKSGTTEIKHPCVGLLGAGSEEAVTMEIGLDYLQSGIVHRITWVARHASAEPIGVPRNLDREALAALAGDIKARIAALPPEGRGLRMGRAAREEHEAWIKVVTDHLNATAPHEAAGIMARHCVVALKVALIHGVVNGQDRITPQAMQAGHFFVARNLQRPDLVVRILRTDKDRSTDLRVEDAIAGSRACGIRRSKLVKSLSPGVRRDELNASILRLVHAGRVCKEKRSPERAGRKFGARETWYFVPGSGEEGPDGA